MLIGLEAILKASPKPVMGRPRRDDPAVLGVEWLLQVWQEFADKTADQSRKQGGFGAFAEEFLTYPPLAYGEGAVRHAVSSLLPRPKARRRDAD